MLYVWCVEVGFVSIQHHMQLLVRNKDQLFLWTGNYVDRCS